MNKLEQKIQEQNDTIDNPNNSLKTKNKELEDLILKMKMISQSEVSQEGVVNVTYNIQHTYRQTDRYWRNLYKIIHLLIAQALSTPAVWSRRGKVGGY